MNLLILVPLFIYALYQVHDGVEVSESQKMIPGVQSDKDVLGEGRIKQCSHRSDDSGLYWCEGNTESSGKNDLTDIVQPELNVIQTSYQARENHNITLELMFSPKLGSSWINMDILCELITTVKRTVVYIVCEGVEVSKSQDEKFSGRVQSDKDALREGRIRLQLSRLRTDDSGLYVCKVLTDDCAYSAKGQLNVTAFYNSDLQAPTVHPQPESKEGFSTAGLMQISAVVLFICVICGAIHFFIFRRTTNRQTGNLLEEGHFVSYQSISAESKNQPSVSSTSV